METPTGGSTGNPIGIDLGWGYYGERALSYLWGSVLTGKDNVIEAALKLLK